MSQYVTTSDGQRHKFPDEATPEQIKAALSGYAKQRVPQLATMPSPVQMLGNRAAALLPAAGGLAGGLIGGAAGLPEGGVGAFPLGVAGAALGGTIGKAAQNLITGSRSDPFLAGAGQGALEATGQIGGRIAGRIGRSLIPKTVTFQKAATPSVILDEFARPFMVEGPTITFTKGATKGAKHAADVALDVASHSVPGGVLLRPAVRGLRGKVSKIGSPLGKWLTSPGAQHFARHFPRAMAALVQLANYEEPDTTSMGR